MNDGKIDPFRLEQRFLGNESRILKIERLLREVFPDKFSNSADGLVIKEKVEWVRPAGEEPTTAKYFRFFDDGHIALHLGETTLRFVIYEDSTAYDVPLKILTEVLCKSLILDREKEYQWVDDDGEVRKMPSINTKLKKFGRLVELSEVAGSRGREAHLQYIFMEWMLGMQ